MRSLRVGGMLLMGAVALHAQLDPLSRRPPANNPVTQPTLSPGVMQLLQLDAQFAKETLAGGGKAFAGWFADDALTLNNGKAPVYGKTNIASNAAWDPKQYQLQWSPVGGQMGPSGDMGFTWGHYEGRAKDRNGNEVSTTGRYITIWKRLPDGSWKVALDASAEEPAAAGECCKLPNP